MAMQFAIEAVVFRRLAVTAIWLLANLAALAGPASAADQERYKLELYITWSQQTHGYDWPREGGHLSSLVGVVHNARFRLFEDGHPATPGLQQLAETGKTAVIERELDNARASSKAGAAFFAGDLKQVPGILTAEFDVTVSNPLLSFATMLAPSPDWFTGASAVHLRPRGQWLDNLDFLIWAWDAGTDSGVSYQASNRVTNPAQSVRLLATRHVISRNGLKPIGRAVLTRVFD